MPSIAELITSVLALASIVLLVKKKHQGFLLSVAVNSSAAVLLYQEGLFFYMGAKIIIIGLCIWGVISWTK